MADLFATAASGDFPHLTAYFAPYPPEKLTEDELLSHLRRLVFSIVNQGIFRLYNEVDPTLGRVLRNIKLALQQFNSLVLVEMFDEPCLVPSKGDLRLESRPLEFDELESGLRNYVKGTENIPFMLGRLALFLQERPEVSRAVPLTLAARVFRSIYVHRGEVAESAAVVEEDLEAEQIAKLLHDTVQSVKEKKSREYAKKRGIHPALVDIYFTVIEDKLKLTISGDGVEKSLQDVLAEHLNGLTYSEYNLKHKNKLQYLARVTGKEVARKLGRK